MSALCLIHLCRSLVPVCNFRFTVPESSAFVRHSDHWSSEFPSHHPTCQGKRNPTESVFRLEILEKPSSDPTPHPQSPTVPCFLCPPSTPHVSLRDSPHPHGRSCLIVALLHLRCNNQRLQGLLYVSYPDNNGLRHRPRRTYQVPASFIHTAVTRLTHVLVRSCEPHPAFVSPAQTYHVSQAIVMFISNSNFPDHAAQRCGGAVWAAVVSPTSHAQAFFVCDLVECTVALCLSWASLSRSLYLRSSNRIIYLLSCFRCRVLSTEY